MSLHLDLTVTDEILEEIVSRLVYLAKPVKIILFGSNARNEAAPGSDLDLLIVEEEVSEQYDEALRLDRALRDLILPLDLIVVSEAQFNRFAQVPGTLYYRALQEGRILYA
jgi:predicted nucleotidyltransferase